MKILKRIIGWMFQLPRNVKMSRTDLYRPRVVLVVFCFLLLTALCAVAQTGNPAIDAVNTVAVDTNSAFFASQTFDLRSGYNSANTQADLGVDYNLAAHWQGGADFGFATGANTLSSAQAEVMYRIPVHNMEFDGGLAAGYNWDNSKPFLGAVGRFSYVVSPDTGITAFLQPQVTAIVERASKPSIGVIIGVGKSF
jgi:hypothetical protein